MSDNAPGLVDPAVKLGRMANQIATFFRTYPEEEGIAGVQEHIVAFWSPSMRRDLARRVETDPGELDPLVMAAFRRMARGESPVKRETAGPDEAGQLGAADAG